jgi:RNA-directed DNA polymerase
MKTAVKYQTQMNLFGEWVNGSRPVSGTDVLCKRTGKVKQEWISENEKERSLTKDLMAEVCELSNLAAACGQVVKNGGSPGVDGKTTRELKQEFMDLQQELREQLLSGSYGPEAILGKEIPKPQGGSRLLGIPTVKDRLVQQAISQVLSKRYERTFSAIALAFGLVAVRIRH